MVAMYIIFLGIIPAILLVLFLIYYSRHNVLRWWKKPRKSYVKNNICGGHTNPKRLFATRFAKFHDSTSSLRNLLSFKRNDSVHSISNICADPLKQETPVYSNLEELKTTQKLPVIPEKAPTKVPLKKLVKKINKDDIKIASNSDIKTHKPTVAPKPNVCSNDNKPNVVIIKQGLASTTNEMVANSQHRMHNVRRMHDNSTDTDTYVNVKTLVKGKK